MPQNVTFDGTLYAIPLVNETGWGTTLTNFFVDIAGNAVTLNGVQTLASKTIKFASGASGAPSITFSADTTTGVYLPTAGHLSFQTASVDRLQIDGNGNVTLPTGSLIVSTGNLTLTTGALSVAGNITVSTGNLALTAGNLSIGGTVTLTNALTVANGGTGATTAAAARTNLGLGSAAVENTGNTVADPGTGSLEIACPVNPQTGVASYTLASTDRGKTVRRTNSGAAMSDTLPGTTPGVLVAGWTCTIINNDGAANDVITAGTGATVNGVASLTLEPGQSAIIVSDGANYWTSASTNNASSAPSGTVNAFAGSTAPSGWLLANGASYSTTTYAALFAVVAYTYGGSGSSFNVPDLRGRFIAGWDPSNATGRLTSPVSAAAVGNVGGAQNETIAITNLPNYDLPVTDPGHAHTLAGGGNQGVNGSTGVPGSGNSSPPWGTGVSNTGISVNTGGSGTALPTVPPAIVLNYIIKT